MSNDKTSRGTARESRREGARLARLMLALALLASCAGRAGAQQTQSPIGDRDRAFGLVMLRNVRADVESYYYDPSFGGVDVAALFKTAEERIRRARSYTEIYAIIAAALNELGDSHTYFLPPARAQRPDYGVLMQMVGARCYAVEVTPGSDAEKQGLRPGDEVLAVEGFRPTRENFWTLRYLFYALKPQTKLRLEVSAPGAAAREVEVRAKILPGYGTQERAGKKEARPRAAGEQVSLGDILVWKLSSLRADDRAIDEAMKSARAHSALVLDLRGNEGGARRTLLRLVGHFFDRDVKVGDLKERKGARELVARTRGPENVFKGRLVVLIDSRTASAAEAFARVVQLEKRGTVVGDRTAGMMMWGRTRVRVISWGLGGVYNSMSSVIPYGASVTVADMTMRDGGRLENVGVAPDELLLPSAQDLSAGRDTMLARAAQLLGTPLDHAKLAALFIKPRRADLHDAPETDESGDDDEDEPGGGDKKPL